MKPRYIVKKRSMEAARPNMYGHKVRHGRWHTVSWHDTAEVALQAAARVVGLYDVGVFFGGRRINGRR